MIKGVVLETTKMEIDLSKNIQLNSMFDVSVDSEKLRLSFRIGGVHCCFVVPKESYNIISLEAKSPYSKKILNEFIYGYETLNFYYLFLEEGDSKELVLIEILRKLYHFFIKNIIPLNSSFRLQEGIENLKNIVISQNIKSDLFNKQQDMLDTMDYIYNNRASLARFGDGELSLVADMNSSFSFQKNSLKLNLSLIEVLSQPSKNLLVCLPISRLQDQFWRSFWYKNWPLISRYCTLELYGTAQISRPVFFYAYGQEGVHLWKRLWKGKRVCYIYGEGSRFNKLHSLFDCIQGSIEILGKSSNAYEDIDSLKDEAYSVRDDVDIYLIALGPAGTVLASMLAKLGLWALDIGHLSNSYDTVFFGEKQPEYIGK